MMHTSPTRCRLFPNADAIAGILSDHYGNYPHGNKANPLHELLFILCSLQTNENLYQSTYASLRTKFPSFRLLADASEEEIVDAIACGGLGRQKARTIRQILSRLDSDFGAPTLAPLRTMSDAECEVYLGRSLVLARKPPVA